MDMLATSTITAIDLLNFSQNIAELNLGYLGISVAILGVLGGVFVYFNIKPLKDALDKQEKTIDDLKKEARGLLSESGIQTEKSINEFKNRQSKDLTAAFDRQAEKLKLETTNKVQEVEKNLLGVIESTSENKDLKLREIILSETSNRLASLEKELTSKITSLRQDMTKGTTDGKATMNGLEARIKEIHEEVKELQVYKYSKEGQLGAVIISIDLLKESIDDYLKFKELLKDTFDEEVFGWKVKNRLRQLMTEIGESKIEEDYIAEIEIQLNRVTNQKVFAVLLDELRNKLKKAKS